MNPQLKKEYKQRNKESTQALVLLIVMIIGVAAIVVWIVKCGC